MALQGHVELEKLAYLHTHFIPVEQDEARSRSQLKSRYRSSLSLIEQMVVPVPRLDAPISSITVTFCSFRSFSICSCGVFFDTDISLQNRKRNRN